MHAMVEPLTAKEADVSLGPGELLVLVVLVLLFFGPAKLPGFARSLGQAQREFRRGLKDGATRLAPPTPYDHGQGDSDGDRDVARPTPEA
jgi:TatA/E family protein of Tat protein translocase